MLIAATTGGVSQPLQQYLVTPQSLQTITCADVPGAEDVSGCKKIPINSAVSEIVTTTVPLIREPDLQEITTVQQAQVIQQMLGDMRVSTYGDSVTQIWDHGGFDTEASTPGMIENIDLPGNESIKNWWLSILPNATSTGVIRQHALRLNSSLTCNKLNKADVPLCPDDHAIHYDFRPNNTTENALTVNICATQDLDKSPWQLTRNAQDISESVYVDVTVSKGANVSGFATKCSSGTTMGYFELPNLKNRNRAQPLVRDWPPKGTFNDCGYGACTWNER